MSTPLTTLTVSISIDNNLRLFTVILDDIVVIDTCLQRAMDTAMLKFVNQHDNMQRMADTELTAHGQDLRDQKFNFGTP
jgi:hypothetical protein